MAHESRQQRRSLARDMAKTGERVLKGGLALRPPKGHVLGVGQVVTAKLGEHGNRRRAGEAAALAHRLMQSSLAAAPPKLEIACRRGCNYCCHSYVAALPPEVFLVADFVRSRGDPRLVPDAVIARAAALKNVSVAGRIGRKLACPLLLDGECSVYGVRPLMCRQATSLSLASCIDEFESDDATGSVEISAAYADHAGHASVILKAALIAARLPHAEVEFSDGLSVALAQPDAEVRWLAGEDVFAQVARPHASSGQLEQIARQIARDLIA